jgi:hypothetical protein
MISMGRNVTSGVPRAWGLRLDGERENPPPAHLQVLLRTGGGTKCGCEPPIEGNAGGLNHQNPWSAA